MPLHSVSVAGVVVREDGRLLAIRRADNGTWELPGGVLELNETPEAGVAREVWEETGIHVEVDELTGVYKNTTRGIVALVFRCKPSGGTERTSSESTAVSWLTPDDLGSSPWHHAAVRTDPDILECRRRPTKLATCPAFMFSVSFPGPCLRTVKSANLFTVIRIGSSVLRLTPI
ncbi:hypothetical protein SVIOM342S_08927 [Streptomyces violaceorubidus]